MLRRTWAEIHLDRLEHNVQLIQQGLQSGCQIMAMVKADAYGHGAVPVARALCRFGVSWLGVSNLEEAIQLRQAGIQQPILVVSYTPPAEAARLAAHGITQTVMSAAHGQALSQAAVEAGVELSVHIKLDTGMSRVGFVCQQPADVPKTIEEVSAVCCLPGLVAEGIFTHFACADDPQGDAFTKQQFELFTTVTDGLSQCGHRFALRHCCNSAATLRFPEMHLDMVRPGVVLYGLLPDSELRTTYPHFRPVMELKTTISMVKELPVDAPISYNRTFYSKKPMRVATVPIGYADGYSRQMSNRAEMLVDGHRVPVVGRVCMDQCMLDVTDAPSVTEGTVVTVFGGDGDGTLPVDELAAWMNSIHYEVVCLVSKRVSRLYMDADGTVDQLNYLITE